MYFSVTKLDFVLNRWIILAEIGIKEYKFVITFQPQIPRLEEFRSSGVSMVPCLAHYCNVGDFFEVEDF